MASSACPSNIRNAAIFCICGLQPDRTDRPTFQFAVSRNEIKVGRNKWEKHQERIRADALCSFQEIIRSLFHSRARNDANIRSVMELTHDCEADVLAGFGGEQPDH
jgi:hypothetical protein